MIEAMALFTIPYSEIDLFGKPVSVYVLMPVIGMLFILVAGMVFARIKRENISFVFRTNLIVGAVLSVGILYKDSFPFYNWLKPFLFPGMLLVLYAVYWLIAKVFKQNRLYMLTQANLMGMLLPFFFQMGCFHAGCCIGRPYNGPFSVIYAPESYCRRPLVALFPIRIVEATFFLLLFIAAFYLGSKRMKTYHISLFILLNLCVYYGGMALGAPECNALYWFGCNFSAWVSLGLLAAAVAVWLINKRKEMIL